MEQNEMENVVEAILTEAKQFQGYVIVRAESKREWGMRLSNGSFDRVSTGWESGIGIQALTASGVSGFAASDSLSIEAGRELLRRAFSLARRNEELGAEQNREIWQALQVKETLSNPAEHSFEEIPLGDLQELIARLHKRMLKRSTAAAWQTSYRQVEDLWCIGRSDGTLVSYIIPRAVLMHQGTVRSNGKAQSTLVHRSGTDVGIIHKENEDHFLENKAADRAEFALAVCQAPQLPGGHYPLIIDYGLAKGLAHEAFGHAVESDHMEESVLGENGKLREGLQVARPGVHIIDGPISGDWADQPYSANGLKRETVTIVRDGILQKGLGDIFSARKAGMPVSGAGRAESYAYVPLPRMTNIRLIVENMIPMEGSQSLMDEVKKLRDVLAAKNEIREGEKKLLLLGYRGGQVNPKSGDFVFQCDGIIDVADPLLPVYQPSIFSGKILSALKAITGGVGEGLFNAIGTCGKGGQAVPSSGGSHLYLLMEADSQVSLGGDS